MSIVQYAYFFLNKSVKIKLIEFLVSPTDAIFKNKLKCHGLVQTCTTFTHLNDSLKENTVLQHQHCLFLKNLTNFHIILHIQNLENKKIHLQYL